MSQTYIVVQPPQLSLLAEPKGNDFIIGYSPTTGKMVRMSITTLLSGRSVPVWDPDGSYDEDFIVEWQLRFWKSLEDTNEGNIPSENSHWTEVSQDETVVNTTPEILVRTLPKTGHGFAVKNVLTLNGSGVLIKVSDPSVDTRIGIVTEVIDANTFKMAISGYVTGLSGLAAGSKYYAQADGTISTTSSDMPVLMADSATSGYILSAGGGGSGGGLAIADVYANIAAMLAAQGAQEENAYYWVEDATTDGSVTAGWAIYRKLAATTANLTDYVKVQEQESLDITAAANGSETVKGVFEESTDAETASGTATGGTGAKLAITPAKLLTWFASLKASIAELITGTDNTKYITPSALEGKGSVKLRSFANNATGSSTIDCQSQDTCHIVYTNTVTGAITIALTGDTNLQILNVTIPITGANIGITVPSTTRMARSVEVVSGDGWYESTKVLQVSSVGTADTHELSFKRKSSGPTFELVYSGPSRA